MFAGRVFESFLLLVSVCFFEARVDERYFSGCECSNEDERLYGSSSRVGTTSVDETDPDKLKAMKYCDTHNTHTHKYTIKCKLFIYSKKTICVLSLSRCFLPVDMQCLEYQAMHTDQQ